MKKRTWYTYVTSRNLINRIYDMLEYFNFFDNTSFGKSDIRFFLKQKISDICFVETLIKYLDDKLKFNKKKVELRCNLSDLINDLDYLKQYLEH